MTTQTIASRSLTFRIGWIALLAISAVWAFGHIMLMIVVKDEATLFLGWAAFNLYSTSVLFFPFRRGERWAWYTSWILVIGFALPIFFTRESFVAWYVGAAGVMVLSLLLTRPAFFQKA